MVCAGGIAPAPASRKQFTRAIDSRGLAHGFRQITDADAARIAAAQAKRDRKAAKRATSQGGAWRMNGVEIREKACKLLKKRRRPMTSAEIAAALDLTKTAVTAAISNAPRDMFKRAHGTRDEGGKQAVLWELGSRSKPPAVTGMWQI